MAISPFRVSILRGVKAMASGVQNPYGKPQLGAAPAGKSKLAKVQRGPQPRPNKTINNGLVGQPGVQRKNPATISGTGDGNKKIINKGAIAYDGNSAKTALAQSTSVGKKSYGQSGRSAPNIGPVGASGSVGYKQRSMRQAAAKAAMTNMRQKRLNNGIG